MSSHLMRGTKWGVGIMVRATPTAWVMGKRSSERHYLSVVHQRTQLNSFFCFRGLMFGFPGAVIRLFPARIMYSVFVDCLDRKAIWLTSVFFFFVFWQPSMLCWVTVNWPICCIMITKAGLFTLDALCIYLSL